MNFLEYHETIQSSLPFIKFQSTYDTSNPDSPYITKVTPDFKRVINRLEEVPYISEEIAIIKNSALLKGWGDLVKLSSAENSVLSSTILSLYTKLKTFLEIAEQSRLFGSTDTLYIRIPEIGSFDDLGRYANDLKKAIELPITDESISGKVEILSADEGSIIFFISVGTIAAIKLVAAICWAAAVIKKKRAEAKIFELHTKTLELKNDALSIFVEAQKTQLNNILEAEANAIANQNYNHNDPETIERLKLSINTVSDLIDKGVKILPLNQDQEIQKQFPDYSQLNLIESSIKQISNN